MELSSFEDLNSEKVTFKYIFITFFKIGCVSFGGHMALVSLIQSIMVEKDKTLNNEDVINSVTVASFMPGPLAVNVVANLGYLLKGKSGALLSMFSVLLPACILILGLAHFYFLDGYKMEWISIMQYVGVTVGVIILSAGLHLFEKEVALNYSKILLIIFAITLDLLFGNYVLTILLIVFGSIFGLIIDKEKVNLLLILKNIKIKFEPKFNSFSFIVCMGLLLNQILFIAGSFKNDQNILLKIGTVFSGISISLFGGGYVVIPIMQSLFVKDLKWLSNQEFIDAIAFSQVTPGPILVSSTFIGFKLAGISGALTATIFMFIPSAILMILVSKVFNKTKNHPLIKSMILGIKVVVIGLIISSAFKILLMQPRTLFVGLVCLFSFILSYKYKLSPVYLIIGAIFFGTLTLFIK